jgi:hypothetical protein
MTEATHQLGERCTRLSGQHCTTVPKIMKAEIGPPSGLARRVPGSEEKAVPQPAPVWAQEE